MTYFYDATGNRILRMVVTCDNDHNRRADTTQTAENTKNQLKDSSTIGSFEIVLLAPNPTVGPFHVTCNQDLVNATVTVIDLTGNVVSQTTVNGRDVPMDISHLAPGTYQVIVANGSKTTDKDLQFLIDILGKD
jgi:hypothetical protein